MISLIINADDLGINPERDRGILKAFQEGIVTSSTMIANGSSFTTAAELARSVEIPIGVHLNLSDGITLCGEIKGLTDQNNRLPGKQQLRRYLLGDNCDLAGIRREFSLQIEAIMATGLNPGHIDGHQHCQIYPPLTAMIIGLAREYGFDAMRSSCPADSFDTEIPKDLVDDLTLFRRLGQMALVTLQEASIRTPHGLWGLPQLHSLNKASLCKLLEDLPEGNWELMVHPGYPNPQGRPFEGEQRLSEVQALCSTEAKEVIARRNIRLCTFGDLPCAS